ncbi:MAG: hypothetical protein Q8L15_10495 [Methylobacter sp.]|nr:hypothetical protein [Methylobacter sp.]
MPKLLPNPFFVAMTLTLAMLPTFSAAATQPVVEPKAGLSRVIEQIEFRDITVGDALRILSEQSSLNIIASKEAADVHVTMFLRRVTPIEVIEAISKTYNLWYKRDFDSNIVRLYTVKEYRLEQVEFKKEETEIFTLKNAKNALDLAETIQNLFSSRVRLSYGRNQQELMTDLQQRFARFDMIDRRTTQHFSGAGTTGGAGGGGTNGITTTGTQQFGNQQNGNQQYGNQQYGNQGYGQNGQNGRPQQLDEQLDALGNVIGKLNNAQQNANQGQGGGGDITGQFSGDIAETRGMVDASVRHLAPIFVGVIKHQNRVLVRSRDMDAMNEIRAIYKRLDVDSSMLLMEVKILAIDLSDGFDSLFDFKLKNGSVQTSTMERTGADLLTNGLQTAAAAFNPALLATVVSKNFEARMQLLEKENRITQLATPILLTSNQEVSRFFVGSEIPIITGYVPGTTNINNGLGGITITVPPSATYTQRKVGNTLLLTPNINADNTVSIQVLVEQSSVAKNGATILVSGGTGLIEQPIDTVQEKTFSGSVIAKDNNTVAVGGLIEEGAGNKESKVPFLGDIPLLGFFFREEGQTRSRTELVVIIKPHIITSPAEAQQVSEKMMKENSVHPNAEDAGNLDVYTNPDHQHKGYKLERPFKEYNNQDSQDRYQWDNPNPLR